MSTLTELKAKREALDRQIAEMEAKEWPKIGDRYYTLDGSGIVESEWKGDPYDNERKNGLGVYQTAAEAQYAFNEHKLLREMREFCEERNPQGWDWRKEGNLYGVDFIRNEKKLKVGSWSWASPLYGKLKERPHAEELLEKFGDRIMEVINFKK